MVLQEVFGSDLSSDEEELQLRRNRPKTPPRQRAPSRTPSPSPRRTPTPPPQKSVPRSAAAAALAEASDDESEPERTQPSSSSRRPIRFNESDGDDEDEPASASRRRKSQSFSEDEPSDDEDSGAEERRRRERVARKRKLAARTGKTKKARLQRRDELENGNDGDARRKEERDDLGAFIDEADGSGGLAGPSRRYGDEDEEEVPPEPKKPKNAFEKAVEENKALRRPRRKEVDPAKIEADCVQFLERMMKARDDDIKAYKAGKPALNKLKMLREVELMAMKVSYREQLLDNMLLAIIKAWLDPMSDGALPNVHIRQTLLQILSSLRVDSDWVERLESSQGLGRLIHYLSIHDDHPPNRRIAEKLMMKWARPVYQTNANFHDLLDEFDKPDEGRRAPKEGVASERRAARETVKHFMSAQDKLRAFKGGKDDQQVLAAIPRRTPFLFTTLAEGTTSIDDKQIREMRNTKARNKKVNRTMSTLRRANKNRSARAAKPSLNGRGR